MKKILSFRLVDERYKILQRMNKDRIIEPIFRKPSQITTHKLLSLLYSSKLKA